MSNAPKSPAASAPHTTALLHHRAATLSQGAPVAAPITLTSTYYLEGEPAPGVPGYGRPDNATWQGVEAALALIEGAPCCLFPSGMGAIAAALFTCVKAGDHILLPADGYYATRVLAQDFLAPLGVQIHTRPTLAFAEGGFAQFALVFIETPSNPGLEVCDIAAIAAAARAAGARTIVDNTTLTPFGQRPLELGADMVVAADTKAPGGHGDILMGHVATHDPDLRVRVTRWRTFSGAIPGPHEAWLLGRSLETLALRFTAMCDNAAALAQTLIRHPRIKNLRYPGLSTDPSHALATQQQSAYGFLLNFELESAEAAEIFINTCQTLIPATSFGSVHSTAERRARWGDAVPPGFIRLSAGIEPREDLMTAVGAALDRA